MALNTQERKNVIYFTGTEVEHTIMQGQPTLFVVGVQPIDEIVKRARAKNIRHLYFGTSQSFTPEDSLDWQRWDTMIGSLLSLGYWVTLDFDIKYAPEVLEYSWNESNKFIAMISAKLPYIRQFNYNATLKLDDTTWGHSNSGVWCHNLHEMQATQKYTDWSQYTGDDVV